MTFTAANLLEYVGAKEAQLDFVTECWDEAVILVTKYVEGPVEVPQEILDRAFEEVGAELFNRKSAKNGIAQFSAVDGQPVRIARDPMVAAYPLLDRFVGGGFA